MDFCRVIGRSEIKEEGIKERWNDWEGKVIAYSKGVNLKDITLDELTPQPGMNNNWPYSS